MDESLYLTCKAFASKILRNHLTDIKTRSHHASLMKACYG